MPPLLTGQVSGYSPISESNNIDDDCVCRVKCVLVGDGAVGKTSLIIGYTTNAYPREYMPTAYDKYSVVVNINNQPVRLQICDTAGQDDFDALRPLCYPHTDVFLLCFSVVYPTSFYNIAEKWTYEIKHHCPKVPIILVGTQSDLRTDTSILIELSEYREQPVSAQEAKALAARIGAIAYVECSAVTRRNLKEVFDTALVAALKLQRPELVYPKTYSEEKSGNFHKSHKHLDSGDIGKKRGWKKLWCFS